MVIIAWMHNGDTSIAGDGHSGDFEAWARTSARLLRRPPAVAAGILREQGLEHTWAELDRRWFAALLADLEAGRTERVTRYRAICAEVMEARELSGAEIPSPLDALRPRKRTPSDHNTPAFAKRLAPVGAKPKRPSRQQASTSLDMSGAVDQEIATERALSWPQERFAWLCAQLEQQPARSQEIWQGEGIHTREAEMAVLRSWTRRFDNDPSARAKHAELLRTYRLALNKPLV